MLINKEKLNSKTTIETLLLPVLWFILLEFQNCDKPFLQPCTLNGLVVIINIHKRIHINTNEVINRFSRENVKIKERLKINIGQNMTIINLAFMFTFHTVIFSLFVKTYKRYNTYYLYELKLYFRKNKIII